MKPPEGEAPLWAREAFRGLVLPLLGPAKFEYECKNAQRGVVRDVYVVSQKMVLAILAIHRPAAHQWWQEYGFNRDDSYGVVDFPSDVCEETDELPSLIIPVDRMHPVSVKNVIGDLEGVVDPSTISEMTEMFSPENWRLFSQSALTFANICTLVEILGFVINEKIETSEDSGIKRELYVSGHSAMKIIYHRALECGIKVTLEEIDTPFMEIDLALEAGYMELTEYELRPTETGMEILLTAERATAALYN